MINQFSKRWGEEEEYLDSIDLLSKKDQQIKRLQAQLQEERRRSENALKLLQSYKTINTQTEQASQGLRSEINRRMKAQEEVKCLKKRNQQLQNGIKQLMKSIEAGIARKINQENLSLPVNSN